MFGLDLRYVNRPYLAPILAWASVIFGILAVLSFIWFLVVVFKKRGNEDSKIESLIVSHPHLIANINELIILIKAKNEITNTSTKNQRDKSNTTSEYQLFQLDCRS